MKMQSFTTLFLLVVAVGCLPEAVSAGDAPARKPNFIIIFTDDQGYGDLSCFGGKHVKTPEIDRLADEGSRLTSFYVAAPVCTPSRAALMTGCYPRRIDMATGSNFCVLLAGDRKGLHPNEITIAEVLRDAGYATAIFGKWHLGDQPQWLPTRQGFDEYFGIPYSHDIHPYHPNQKHFNFPPLPLLEDEKVIESEPDADYLTRRVTERAVRFIEANKDRPFFLYVPHPIPHAPLHVSPPYMENVSESVKDKLKEENDSIDYRTRRKLFPQAISEIDWSVGQIIETLKKYNLDRDTLVIFTSDNGPAIGSAGPLRGRKGSTFEGGMREPTVAWWPGRVPAGKTNDELLTSMDLLPTLAKLAGAKVPDDRVIDGKDIWPVLAGQPAAKSPHDRFFYYGGNRLRAVRSGNWKLHLPRKQPKAKGPAAPALYDLGNDLGEKNDVAAEHPEVVERLSGYAAEFEKDLAAHGRPAAWIDHPKPLLPHKPKQR
ncbi:MAG: sulfatase [Pirellulales bacterium]|nr:sulfatase [Pirellulales bacterium]